MKDSIIIFSGGLDSTTMLYEYKDDIALALSFDYGSNHNKREEEFAKYHCEKLGIEHIIIPLTFIHDYFKSSLLEGASDVGAGDLVFFQGTYNTSGASHVGIVVDPVKKIMIHCGNPIQYASYDTAYWRAHAYCYGRIQ